MAAKPSANSVFSAQKKIGGLAYAETFVGHHDVVVTCELPGQHATPRIVVTVDSVVFPDLRLQIQLPVSVVAGEFHATFINGTIDVHLRREAAR